MKLKYQFVFQQLGEIYMGVAVGGDAKLLNGMLQLNEVGYDIVSLMTNDISKDEIIENILENYDTDRDTATQYVDEVIDYLTKEDVLII